MNFSSKRVLVTAGANGIGLAIAKKFGELGATVFVSDIDPDAVEKARANGLAAAVSDVSDEEQENVNGQALAVDGNTEKLY